MKKLLFALFLTAPLLQAAGKGTTGAEVLNFGAGARATGLAGTQAALSDDVFAAYWNPAALGLLKSPAAAASHNRSAQDVSHQFAVGAAPLRRFGTFALSLHRLAVEDFYGADAQGTVTGALETGAQATGFAWGKNLSPKSAPGGGLFVGFSFTSLKETVANVDGTGRSYDLGLLWRPVGGENTPAWVRRSALGAALRRQGSGPSFDGSASDLPAEMALGASHSFFLSGDIVNLGLDYHAPEAEPSFLSLGAEYWLKGFLALRAGVRTGQDSDRSWRAGMSFRLKPIQVDYAWSALGADLGDSHQLSLSWRFGPAESTLLPGVADDLYAHHLALGQAHMNLQMYDRAVLEFYHALRIRPKDDKAQKLLLECGEAMKR